MRKFVVLLVVVLAIAAAWSGAWFYGAGTIRAAVDRLGSNDGETQPRVTCGRFAVTGFPFRFDLECADATIVSGDVTTTLAGFRASVLAYNPTQAKLSWLAPMTVADAFSGAQSRIDFAGAEGSVRLKPRDTLEGLTGAGWRIERVSLVADDIAWVDTVLGDKLTLGASHLEAHLLDMPERHDADAATSALAAYAQLSEAVAPDLGVTGGEASLEAELSGLPDDLRAFGEETLRSWQAAGGQLKLVGLRGEAGEEFIDSTGTLALDAGGRLDGQIELKSRGLVERIERLLPQDWMLLLLGQRADDGSYAQTLSIRSGVVFSGLVPITMIPPLL